MDANDLNFIVSVVSCELLGEPGRSEGIELDGYWAGEVQVPKPISADLDGFFANGDRDALVRASLWIARHFVLAGDRPMHHLALVKWLLEHGRIGAAELPELLALESTSSIDETGREIVLLARELLEERRSIDSEWTILPMLLGYSPSI